MEETKRSRGLICCCSTSEMYEPSVLLIIVYIIGLGELCFWMLWSVFSVRQELIFVC